MEYTMERQAREYIRSLLGDRPYMVVYDGVYYGYSPRSRRNRILRYYFCTNSGTYYTNDDEEPESDIRELLYREYHKGQEIAYDEDFRESPWFTAVLSMARGGYDWSSLLPDKDGMEREAFLVSSCIRDIEAEAVAGKGFIKAAGNIDPEYYIKKKAPWMSTEAALKRMAEKL